MVTGPAGAGAPPAAAGASPGAGPAFGYDDPSSRSAAFTPVQRWSGVGVLVLLAGVVAFFALTSQPASTARPDLFGGSLVLSNGSRDNPTVVDLASGNPTLILSVGDPFGFPLSDSKNQRANLRYIRSTAGDYVVNRTNGDTNLLRTDHLVLNRKRPFRMPAAAAGAGEVRGVTAEAAGDRLFLVRHAATGTDIQLVDAEIVRLAGPSAPTGDEPGQAKGIALDAGSADEETAAATAGDALYVLVDQGSGAGVTGRELRRITEPESKDDLLLRSETVLRAGPKAEVVTAGDGVAVLDPDAGTLTVVPPGPSPTTRPIAVPEWQGAASLLPADGGATSVWALAFSGGSWRVAGADLVTGKATAVLDVALDGRADEAAAPVVNGTTLYTASRTNGRIIAVGLDAVGGPSAVAFPYPDVPDADGQSDLARNPDAYRDVHLFSIGPRVVVNVPFAKRASLFETDTGARREIVKTEAPELDPTAPPIPGNKRQERNDATTSSTSSTALAPGQSSTTTSSIQVQKELPCEERDQQPRKPQLDDAVLPSAREVRIEWTYTPQDPRDCFPSRYRIEVSDGEGNTTPPPEPFWVASTGTRHAAVVTGLRPNRRWKVVVVAALGQRETPSDPLDVQTADTGPDPAKAPVSDGSREGGWNVSWDACAGDACDRQAAEWQITPDITACNNPIPIAAVPPSFVVPGRTHGRFVTIDELGPDFVGARVRFGIVGVDGQLRSDTTVWTECVEGWKAPAVAPDFDLFTEPTGDTFRLVARVNPLVLDPRKAGSQDVSLVWTIDNVSTGPPSKAESVTKDGLAPQTKHSATLQLTHHGRSSAQVEKTVTTNPLPWTNPSFELSPLERVSPDDHTPDYDRAKVSVTVGNLLPGDFSGTATVKCGSVIVATAPFTLASPGAVLGPFTWDIAGNTTTCSFAFTLSEVVPPGGAPRYSAAAVGQGLAPVPTNGVLPGPKAVITVVGWETLPPDGTSTYDATGYWKWVPDPAPAPPTQGTWVDNGVVKVTYDTGLLRPGTKLSVAGNPAADCSLVPATATGEWLIPGHCFTLAADGVTATSTDLAAVTTYFGLPGLSMLDAPIGVSDTPRLPKPTAPPP